MVNPHLGPRNLPIRRTMIKDTVGKVRKPAYNLPDMKDPSHIYGHEVKKDDEDAGQVIGKWVQSTPSPAAESSRSFVETNRRALAHGCTNAKANREFAQSRSAIRERPPQKRIPGEMHHLDEDTTYGIKTAVSEDINGLIQAKDAAFDTEETDYPDLSTMSLKGRLPMPRETRTSLLKDKRHQAKNQPKEPFKMKKFSKVGGVISTQPKKTSQLRRTDVEGDEDQDNNIEEVLKHKQFPDTEEEQDELIQELLAEE